MKQIMTTVQMVQNETTRRTRAVTAKFRQAIRPIYIPGVRNMPVHVGSCTLLNIGGTKLIVTAAHIVHRFKAFGFLIGGTEVPVSLIDNFYATSAPNENPDDDKYDFAACAVSDTLATQLGNVAYVGAEWISLGRRIDHKHSVYVCAGYPNSQNKIPHATSRRIGMGFFTHTAKGHSINDKVAPWARSTTDHLFVSYEKYSVDPKGVKRRSSEPRGMSGGPVFYIGDFGDPDIYQPGTDVRPTLEAIIIEKSNQGKVLIAVRIGTVMEALRNVGILGEMS
jgi:hypothetical protein